ncbi:hypothetical protein VM57_11190 [Stenotrophomonas maltophilia]|uniref:Uncharacterized protein n=1 Tax=Stenotrophomonas maltophilia TaxID=40324 RepID=A0A0F5ZNC8_STEMA|nr:hypothetical protein VM57_11190 [Stenotrophomonas maltophilia]
MIDTTHYVTGAPVTWKHCRPALRLPRMFLLRPSIASRWILADDARRHFACIPRIAVIPRR